MVFNSLSFFIFFAILLSLYYLIPQWRFKKLTLLVSSYIFYGAFHLPFVFLLLLSTIVDWNAGNWIQRSSNRKIRSLCLSASLATNLGMLSFFKYGNFILENFTFFISKLGFTYNPIASNIILPVGISYYTFQTLSYTIDVFRKDTEANTNFLDFALFVSFFPQLVAGPIVRAKDFLVQTKDPNISKFNGKQFLWGIHLLVLGLFGKIVLADRLFAPVVNLIYSDVDSIDFMSAWVGTIAFSGQIYFDFSGYSICAIGVALCLGFALPDNFRFPYAAMGFSDFWQRWHISLSTWLRDYLYIPLGGNRKGTLLTYRNLMITMLLGGLWHGASWNFVVWGAIHGFYLYIERLWRLISKKIDFKPNAVFFVVGIILTYFSICLTWVFFRAETLVDAFLILKAMLSFQIQPDTMLQTWRNWSVVIVMAGVILYQCIVRDMRYETVWTRFNKPIRVLVFSIMLFLIFATRGEQSEFIYFQF